MQQHNKRTNKKLTGKLGTSNIPMICDYCHQTLTTCTCKPYTTHNNPTAKHKTKRTHPAYRHPHYTKLRHHINQHKQYPCHNCKQPHPPNQIEIDHHTPLSQNGAHTINNLRPLCKQCHAQARTKQTENKKKNKLLGN